MLPPDAIIASHVAVHPAVHAAPVSAVGAEAVGVVLGRSTVAVGAGHVLLDQVDRRLTGLMARINAYRVVDIPSALVSTGLVVADDAPLVGFRATPRELWDLARETLAQRGDVCEPVEGLGEAAFLTLRGAHTAQIAWITAERLATVGVTSMQAETAWVVAAVRALAGLVGGQQAMTAGTSLRPSAPNSMTASIASSRGS